MTKKTYSDVKAQIEALQLEADALRAQEVEAVLADVKAKVAEYGLTEQDVFGKKRAGKAKTASAPKYRDPKTGATWSGKGRAPSWIASARNRDRFLIAE
ncbi:H-NS histone family protein [Burkholderia gladioli]|uniref:H-NS histone family protein n=1 Tax=Burkholderia gladioli TaxID=28095 RepID=UPI00285CC451|nr:H-NS histone family protein [Burkholderia gladioli]MDR8092949.1 H-NS histone family protein [Burkholderia gladioli]